MNHLKKEGKTMNQRKKCLCIISLLLMGLLFDIHIEATKVKAENMTQQVSAPKGFQGASTNGKIKLKWKKNSDASGYILYRNEKKLKTLKSKNTSYVDKKVKINKKYKYQILSYKKTETQTAKSAKSYKVTVVATDKKSKKLNAARFVNIKSNYKIGWGETLKLKPVAKYSKKIKGKYKKGKKVYSKKIKWKSSNPQLVKVNKNGKITATSERVIGTAKITARSHNGIRKTLNVSVVNFARLDKIQNLEKVKDEGIKKLLTTQKDATSIIADFFQNNIPNQELELTLGMKQVKTEDGAITHAWSIIINPEEEIESNMYNYILKYLSDNYRTSIKITKDYIRFQKRQLYTWGYELNDLVYVFNNKSALDNYQYDNAVYDIVKVADRWYYGTSNAYGLAY